MNTTNQDIQLKINIFGYISIITIQLHTNYYPIIEHITRLLQKTSTATNIFIEYCDEEGDNVSVTCDNEWRTALVNHLDSGNKYFKVFACVSKISNQDIPSYKQEEDLCAIKTFRGDTDFASEAIKITKCM
ncbi:metallophosphoesterase [Acrasis kona]|uniref:Metallophosphoesterase n=1 Tax=Acrasis kona TaxID=1008807 RepID=A0AAW2ZGM6_9EUKA